MKSKFFMFFCVMLALMSVFDVRAQGDVFTEGFEGTAFPPDGWTRYNLSGGTLQWARTTTAAVVYDGSGAAYFQYNSGLQEGLLVTPQVLISDADAELTFWSRVQGYDPIYTPEAYSGVWVSTGDNDPASFVEIKKFEGDELSDDAWQEIVVSLSS